MADPHPHPANPYPWSRAGFKTRDVHYLQELVGERVTEVLPALQTLFLDEPILSEAQEAIGEFVAMRQLAGRPVAISCWKREESEEDD